MKFTDTIEHIGFSGPAIVHVHGFPLDRNIWRSQKPVCAGHVTQYRFDLPGFGEADPPDGPISLRGYAENVLAIMDHLRLDKAILCGLSMGGYVLLEACCQYPDRIAGLIFCDTRAEADDEAGRARRDEMIARIERDEKNAVLDELLTRSLCELSRQKEHRKSVIREMMDRASPQGLVGALKAMRDRADHTRTLATIKVPTLVIVGKEDELTPPAVVRRIHAGITGSVFVEVESAGHLANLEKPTIVNPAMETWLKENFQLA